MEALFGLHGMNTMLSEKATRTVRVRVDAEGDRLVGEHDLPADPLCRFSDVLNEPGDFFKLRRVLSASGKTIGEDVAVRKDSIRYVEALEEPAVVHRASDGTFCQVAVMFRDRTEALQGELFVPASSDVLDILNDPRLFISVRNVSFFKSKVAHAFLVVGKKQISLVSV